MPNPALEDTLTDKKYLLGSCFREDHLGNKRRKAALVPGCGKGYDVLLLASFGYDAFGLEVSETAVKRCYEEQRINGHKYPARYDYAGSGSVTFLVGDFFSLDWLKKLSKAADLIYDYTVRFLLAPTLSIGLSPALLAILIAFVVPFSASTKPSPQMGASDGGSPSLQWPADLCGISKQQRSKDWRASLCVASSSVSRTSRSPRAGSALR